MIFLTYIIAILFVPSILGLDAGDDIVGQVLPGWNDNESANEPEEKEIPIQVEEKEIPKQVEEKKIPLNYYNLEHVQLLQQKMMSFGDSYEKNWMVMGNSDGYPLIAMLNYKIDKTKEDLLKLVRNTSSIYIFNRNHPNGKKIQKGGSLNLAFFNRKRETKIITHGWFGNAFSESVTSIKNEYLKLDRYNIMVFDWSYLANDPVYTRAAIVTELEGELLAQIINELVARINVQHVSFHLIGFSLGAHIMGVAGRSSKEKVKRITALDPARFCFENDGHECIPGGPLRKLSKTDARFVDVIHTCAGVSGYPDPLGHVDFYPNGGSPFQPGCNFKDFPTQSQVCSHSLAYKLFAKSISNENYIGKRCADFNSFKLGTCEEVFEKMGEDANLFTEGIFYLMTNKTEPMGWKGVIYNGKI